MDLLQLEHFLAVVEEGSFSRAAEKVFRTQPAISQSIKKLEEEIGAPLFARDLHEVSLTEAGRLLVEYARRMLRLRDQTLMALGELRSLHTGSVSIAAAESAALYLLPGALRSFLERFPHIKLSIYRRPIEEIPGRVMDREVDVGFVLEQPSFRELTAVPIHADRMILIASPQHPLARHRSVNIGDLGQERFVTHHGCTGTSQKVLRLFEATRTPFRVAAELWGFESIKNFVLQGVGLAIVPRITALQELCDRSLVQIPVEGLEIPRQTFIICRDQRYLSDAARELLSLVGRSAWSSVPLAGGRA
jgi:DNA-binding transcriptional LysR family regulator